MEKQRNTKENTENKKKQGKARETALAQETLPDKNKINPNDLFFKHQRKKWPQRKTFKPLARRPGARRSQKPIKTKVFARAGGRADSSHL